MMANIKKLSLISIWLFGLTFPFVGIANAFYFFIITLFISSIWLLYKAMDIKLPAGIILPPRLKRGLDRKGARITAAAILAIPALLLPFLQTSILPMLQSLLLHILPLPLA